MSLIQITGKDAVMEITNRCYTGCPYCYKKHNVHSKGFHVPFRTIKSRIDWVCKFTDADTMFLLGGEPLTHPDFIEICKYVVKKGLKLCVITSGNISNLMVERNNLDYLLESYRNGKLFIELSYHWDRNHGEFVWLVEELKKRHIPRRKAIARKSGYDPKSYDLLTTVVIKKDRVLTQDELLTLMNHAYALLDRDFYERDSETFQEIYTAYIARMEVKNGGFWRTWPINEYTDFRVCVTWVLESQIEYLNKEPHVLNSGSTVCPGIRSGFFSDYIELSSLIIRADGGVSYSEAQCIDTLAPLINVDIHYESASIYACLCQSLDQIQKMVYFYNRQKAQENCGPDSSEQPCTMCPFGNMCTTCWTTPKPWQR